MKKCVNCQNIILNKDKYCRKCGFLIHKNIYYVIINILIIITIIAIILVITMFVASYLVS